MTASSKAPTIDRPMSGALAATLERASRASGTSLLPAPRCPGWTTVERLAGDCARLGDLLDRLGAELGTERADVRGQRLVELWAWCASAPAAAALVGESRLLDVSAANLLTRLGGPPAGIEVALRSTRFRLLAGDTACGEPRASVAANEVELVESLVRMLAPTPLGTMIETVNALTGRPRSALWRGASDRLTGSLLWAGERLGRPERARVLAEHALLVDGPLAGNVRIDEIRAGDRIERVHVRNGCCIWHRVPGEIACIGCPLVGAAERRARVLDSAVD